MEAQKKVVTSFIFRGLDLSLANYADDVLNLSRTYAGIEENIDILSYEYKQIGLRFNPEKSEVVVVGKSTGRSSAENIRLGSHLSKPSSSITYLGLPIGSSLKHTRTLLLEFLSERLRRTYGLLVSCKSRYKRAILGRIYNAFAVPHLLALAPFWELFSQTEKNSYSPTIFPLCEVPFRYPSMEEQSTTCV